MVGRMITIHGQKVGKDRETKPYEKVPMASQRSVQFLRKGGMDKLHSAVLHSPVIECTSGNGWSMPNPCEVLQEWRWAARVV